MIIFLSKNGVYQILLAVFVFSLFSSCEDLNTEKTTDQASIPSEPGIQSAALPYDFETPELTFELPNKLKEISGLSLSYDDHQLMAINDEKANVYFINKKSGEVSKGIDFGKPGDYEGIEAVGSTIYVVQSSGRIYEIAELESEDQGVQKHKSFLETSNDVEGLCFDKKNNRLLLACKGKGGKGTAFKLTKSIYSFDLETKKMPAKPAYSFSLDDVHNYLKANKKDPQSKKLWEFFDPDKSKMEFSPSAVAIHPITGDIYISSSVGKLLLILNSKGKISNIKRLKKGIHQQPEGLCFEEDGTLWISNEAKNGEKAKVYRFGYKVRSKQ